MVEAKEPTAMQKYVAEIVGTFILVWIGPGAAVVAGMLKVTGLADVMAIAIAFGIAVAAAIYVVGKVSGCHINPAVTIALAINKRFPWKDVIPYIIAQLIGAVIASLLFVACLGTQAASSYNLGGTFINSGAGVTIFMGFIGEVIGTFFLMITIMGVAVDQRAPAGWAGWIVGMIVTGVIITLGPMTGSSLNPARTFGPYIGNALFGGQAPWGQFIIVYTIGPIVGAIIAAFVYDYMAGTKV
jgi:glycerol uptake facilitator protein